MSDDDVNLEGGLRWKGAYTEPLENNKGRMPIDQCFEHDSRYVGVTDIGKCVHGDKIRGNKHSDIHCWGYGIANQGGNEDCTVVYDKSESAPKSTRINVPTDERIIYGKKKIAGSMTQDECAAYAQDKGLELFYLSKNRDAINSDRGKCYSTANKKREESLWMRTQLHPARPRTTIF